MCLQRWLFVVVCDIKTPNSRPPLPRLRPTPRGSFAEVKNATRKTDGSEWAVKIIERKDLGPEDEAALYQEVEILKKVSEQWRWS